MKLEPNRCANTVSTKGMPKPHKCRKLPRYGNDKKYCYTCSIKI